MAAASNDHDTDAALITRIQTGDDTAAEQLYDRYAGRLSGLAERQMSPRLKTLSDPEDIVQSAFRSLFRGFSAGTFDAPEGRSIWNLLAVIAMNKVRRRGTRQRSVAADVLVDVGLAENGTGVQIESGTSPEQFEVALRETIEHLSELDQRIVMLRVGGHQVDEIAVATGRSVRTIERCLQRIRRELAQELQTDPD